MPLDEPGFPNPHTGQDEWFHGTRAYPEDLSQHGFMDPMDIDRGGYEDPDAETTGHWNALLGTHFTADHKVAHEFATGEHDSGENDPGGEPWRPAYQGVVHARLHLRNPKIYDSEHDMDHEAYEHEFAAGNHPSNHVPLLDSDDEDDRYEAEDMWPHADRLHQEYGNREIPRSAYTPYGTDGAGHPERTLWLSTHPDRHDIAERFRQRLQAQGHDGVVYGNEYEKSQHGRKAVSAIAFHPDQVDIRQHHHAEHTCMDPEEAAAHRGRLPGLGQEALPGLDDYSISRQALVQHFAADEEFDHPEFGNFDEEYGLYHHPDHGWHCHACGDFHDDAETATRHQDSYTDWGRVHPGLPEHMHRGLALQLPAELHDAVHDESAPVERRGRMLLEHLGEDGHGTHWTPDEEQAAHYAGVSAHQNAGTWHGGSGQTHVILHARRPAIDDIETDPDTLADQDVISFGDHDDAEIPIRQGAPVHLTGISWKRADAPDTAWQQHDLPQTHLGALEMTAGDADEGLTWDEIGERHPALYGDPEIHGEAAEGADGEGIGDVAGHLAYDRPGHNYAEGTGEEHPSYTGLRFYPRTIDPARIDYARHGSDDQRVRNARAGYSGAHPDHVPPLILVHRHGVFQVADGHHRGEGASLAWRPVAAYVAYSPHEHEPFSDGERGPFHGAETEEQHALERDTEGGRMSYPGFPHTAETPHPVTAALVSHFAELEPPKYHPEARCPMCGGRNYEREERPGYIPEGSRAPAYCRNCGEAFDASRSGREIAEEREREHREWEEATRNRRYNGEALFHGTRSELHPGDLLTPDEAERHRAHPDEDSRGYMHATTVGEEAYGWGERASGAETHERMTELGRGRPMPAGHSQGEAYRPRVYQVEPTGPVEYDPNGEGEAFRSAHPLRVVQEVHPLVCYHEDHEGEYHWPDHEHYEFLKQQEDDEHEDDDDDWGHEAAAIASADEHDGDGYTVCDQGHEHWGLNGAAGLLVRHHDDDGETRYLLQHRSPYVQHGRTWSTPGGAMGSGETPEHAALREAREEMGELPGDLEHHHTVTDDHGGWSYHTVVMDSPTRFRPSGSGETDWESEGSGWFTPGEIQGLPLHPGFRSSWDKVQHSGSLRVVALDDVPAFTHRYLSAQPDGGYAEREELVQGPFYHGSRSKRLGEGAELTPGRKTNGWGDEGSKSQWVHFTTDLGGAAEYARQAGGHVYEVEPHGDVQMGYSGSDWKSKGVLRVRRVVPPEEIARHQARTGQLIVAANVSDHVLTRGAPIPAAADVHAAIGAWTPQNAREVHECLDEFPLLFRALHEGLAELAHELEGTPVSVHLIAIVRRMAACCQGAAEDATEVAGRPLDGAEGMWEGSRASVGPKA